MKKGLQTLEFSFQAESLTHYGGLFLIQRFCNKLDLLRRLKRKLLAAPDWSDSDPADPGKSGMITSSARISSAPFVSCSTTWR